MRKNDADVISLPVEFDRKKIDTRFRLVIAVTKRAKDLFYGEMPVIATNSRKVTTVALEEVISGCVNVLTGEAALKAGEEAERLTHTTIMDEAEQKVSFPEKLTELEKDLEEYLRKKVETGS
ncbi:MAG TPA: DNA-directed RNA polymerase subunit omega [Nitrospirae bacterium]|nr:DNA-directed RNA polymerase subunit omega [bacterium BMS3Abin06]HDH10916.1 DNA-directed RNA polymerase subunit omega [Nitrospirota bacterium]HDZ00410.1 DNA-directed RNA polymerase subunit omega [Nitrospirota bacterium]